MTEPSWHHDISKAMWGPHDDSPPHPMMTPFSQVTDNCDDGWWMKNEESADNSRSDKLKYLCLVWERDNYDLMSHDTITIACAINNIGDINNYSSPLDAGYKNQEMWNNFLRRCPVLSRTWLPDQKSTTDFGCTDTPFPTRCI